MKVYQREIRIASAAEERTNEASSLCDGSSRRPQMRRHLVHLEVHLLEERQL